MTKNKNGFDAFNFDWEGFQKQLMGNMNFGEGFLPNGVNLPDFGQYVSRLINQHIPQEVGGMAPFKSTGINTEVYDTHNFMITRISVPTETRIENVQVHLKSNQVKVTGLSTTPSHTINLPSKSKQIGSRAIYKDGILELRILKDKEDQFEEIKISY